MKKFALMNKVMYRLIFRNGRYDFFKKKKKERKNKKLREEEEE